MPSQATACVITRFETSRRSELKTWELTYSHLAPVLLQFRSSALRDAGPRTRCVAVQNQDAARYQTSRPFSCGYEVSAVLDLTYPVERQSQFASGSAPTAQRMPRPRPEKEK